MNLTKLMAPFVPFTSENIYQNLMQASDPESVHLSEWPRAEEVDEDLIAQMDRIRKLVESAHSLRGERKVRIRQPLASATVQAEFSDDLIEILKDEINVKKVTVDKNLKTEIEIDFNLTPELEEEGMVNDLIRQIQDLRKREHLNSGDTAEVVFSADDPTIEIIEKNKTQLMKATNLSALTSGDVAGEGQTRLDSARQARFELKR